MSLYLIGEHNLDLGTGLKVYNMGLSKPEKISNDIRDEIGSDINTLFS